MLSPEIQVDVELPFYEVNQKFYNILHQFAPFGPTNLKPIFVAPQVEDTGWSAIVGRNHLKLFARQQGSRSLKGIGYNLGEKYLPIVKSVPFDVCFTLEQNRYNNVTSIQMNVKDIKASAENNLIKSKDKMKIIANNVQES